MCGKIAKETNLRQKERRLWVFVAAFVCVMVLIGLDLRWTNRKAEEATKRAEQLSHLGELPGLKEDLRIMSDGQKAEKVAAALSQVKADQKLDDIQGENKDLRKSVETKDAALVQIARDQYALNFLPQIFVVSNGATDKLTILNNGNYDVTITNLLVHGHPMRANEAPALMPKGAMMQFTLSDHERNLIMSEALGGNADRLPIECTASLTTKNGKNYALGFTWLFNIKDGAIVKTDVIDRPIVEIKP